MWIAHQGVSKPCIAQLSAIPTLSADLDKFWGRSCKSFECSEILKLRACERKLRSQTKHVKHMWNICKTWTNPKHQSLSPPLRTRIIGRRGRENRVVGAMAASIRRSVVKAAYVVCQTWVWLGLTLQLFEDQVCHLKWFQMTWNEHSYGNYISKW